MKKRLLSRRETALIFTAIFLPIQFWMLYNVIMAFPAYVLRLSPWDLLGLFAYTQAFALGESLLIFAGVAFLVLLAPYNWHGEKLVSCVSMLVLLLSFWIILLHLHYDMVIALETIQIGVWLLIILATLALLVGSAVRVPRVTALLIALLDRASVLTVFYLVIDMICVMIVVWRNIGVIGIG